MIDVVEFWAGARLRFVESIFHGRFPPWPLPNGSDEAEIRDWFFRAAHLTPAQIIAERDDVGGRMFQMHPDPERASQKSWVALLQIRGAFRTDLFQAFHGTPAHGFYQEMADKMDADIGYQARQEALSGPEVLDIIAVSHDFSKFFGRLNNATPVAGFPQHPELEDRPVRLFRTIKNWWEKKCAGAVLIGEAWENEDWLRRCEAGIVTDDVAHGQAVKKILERHYKGPRIMVAA